MEKLEGPTTRLIFLGIVIDTTSGSMRLPEEKVACLRQVVQSWARRKACTRRELKSLVGLLHHACRVIRPGRLLYDYIIYVAQITTSCITSSCRVYELCNLSGVLM